MIEPLEIRHAAGCAVYGHAVKPAGFTAGDSCSGPPVCQYAEAQALAANADATPWAARAKELESKHGPYAGFVAWEEWAERLFDCECTDDNRENCHCYNCNVYQWWESTDGLNRTALYAAMAQIPGNAELATLRRQASCVKPTFDRYDSETTTTGNELLSLLALRNVVNALAAHLEEKP